MAYKTRTDFINSRWRYSLLTFFRNWGDKDKYARKHEGKEDLYSKMMDYWNEEYDSKRDITPLFEETNRIVNSARYINKQEIKEERRSSLSEAQKILKKNEGLIFNWQRWKLTDNQVTTLAFSNEKELDLSLFDLTDNQLSILSYYKWDEIILPYKKLTDQQVDIISSYQAKCINLRELLKATDEQIEILLNGLEWKKINLRDLYPTRVQKKMFLKFQWKIINRAFTEEKELNQKIIQQQQERKKIREENRKIRSVAYTSFQYA